MKSILLSTDVRCLEQVGGSLLGRAGKNLQRGTVIEVGEPVTMCYDHQDKLAIPYRYAGTEGFLLSEELGSSLEDKVTVGLPKAPSVAITKHRVELDPDIEIFNLVLETDTGSWQETFGSKADLRKFLRGATAALGILGIYLPEPEIPTRIESVFLKEE